jgi:hypothetical protein
VAKASDYPRRASIKDRDYVLPRLTEAERQTLAEVEQRVKQTRGRSPLEAWCAFAPQRGSATAHNYGFGWWMDGAVGRLWLAIQRHLVEWDCRLEAAGHASAQLPIVVGAAFEPADDSAAEAAASGPVTTPQDSQAAAAAPPRTEAELAEWGTKNFPGRGWRFVRQRWIKLFGQPLGLKTPAGKVFPKNGIPGPKKKSGT